MSPRTASRTTALALILLVLPSCDDPRRAPPLAPVPYPDLARSAPEVRAQLEDARRRLDETLIGGTDGAARAEAFGAMGRLYHAYDLLEPAEVCYRNALALAPRERSWQYYLGLVAQRRGRLADAAHWLEEALARGGPDAATLLRLGDVELARGQPEAARSYFERALEQDATCVAARYGLGEAARASGELEVARRHFQRTLEEQPSAARVHYPLAQVLLALGRAAEAGAHLEAARGREVSVGGEATCPDPLDAALAGLTLGSAAHLRRALQAAVAGDAELELEHYRRAVTVAPTDAVARQSLGSALFRNGDLDGAQRELREAARLLPSDASVRYDLGQVLLRRGDVEQAARSFADAIELDPTFPEARLRLADLLQRQGRSAEAEAHLRQVLTLDPLSIQARVQLALALYGTGRGSEAVAELGDLVDLHPPADPAERVALATALLALGDLDRALRHLRAVADSEAPAATRALAHLRIGQIHAARHHLPAAVRRLEAALALDPDRAEARTILDRLERQ